MSGIPFSVNIGFELHHRKKTWRHLYILYGTRIFKYAIRALCRGPLAPSLDGTSAIG